MSTDINDSDIRVGDLVKATRKDDPKVAATDRVLGVRPHYVETDFFMHRRDEWDFEVLDRPLPQISDELLTEATKAYAKGMGYYGAGASNLNTWGRGVTAVINFVRKYDAEHNKQGENA